MLANWPKVAGCNNGSHDSVLEYELPESSERFWSCYPRYDIDVLQGNGINEDRMLKLFERNN